MKVYVFFETEGDLVDIHREIDTSELDLDELMEMAKSFEDEVYRVCIQPL